MEDAVGLYDLELRSLGTSMEAAVEYLDQAAPKAAQTARDRYGKPMDWAADPQEYWFEVKTAALKGYEREVIDIADGYRGRGCHAKHDRTEFDSAEHIARLVVGDYLAVI